MAAQSTLTFELTSPRRPTLEDVGGATLEDDSEFPPDKTKMPYADQLNQLQKLAAAFGRVAPLCIVWVRIVSGSPTIYAVQAASSLVSSGTFTVTDQATGITRISWPAGTFPDRLGEAECTLTFTTDANNPGLLAMASPSIEISAANEVRIRTYNLSAVATDCNFRLAIY